MDNWKPAAIAAIVVGVLGVLAGVVIGGSGDGDETPTVAQPATTTAADDTTSATTVNSTTTEDLSATGPTRVVDAFDENQLSSNQGDLVHQCIEASTGPTSEVRGLDGQPLVDPTVFEVLYSDRTYCEAWRLELPVSEYAKLDIAGIGWADGVPTEATAEFSIYGDTIGSEPLFTDTMTGPGDTAEAINLELADTDTLILEWKPGVPLTETSDNVRYRFILDGAYLS